MPKKYTSTNKVTFGNGTKGRKGVHAKNKSSWNPNSKNYKTVLRDFAEQTIKTVKKKVLSGNLQNKLMNIDEDKIKEKIKEELNKNKNKLKNKLKKLIK